MMFKRMHMRLAAAAIFALTACANQPEASPASVGLPVLEEVRFAALDSSGPERGHGPILFAVARDGRLAFTGGYDAQDRMITVLDTNGTIERFGREGQGPDEFAPYTFMAFVDDDDILMLFDLAQARISRRVPSGAIETTDLKAHPPGFPARLAVDSIDVSGPDIGAGPPPSIREISGAVTRLAVDGTGQRRIMVGDSAFEALMATAPVRQTFPVVATRADRIVHANPYSHMFQSFDANGRPLQGWGRNLPALFRSEAEVDSLIKAGEPWGGIITGPSGMTISRPTAAQERARLAADQLRHLYAIRFDEADRLWAFGPAKDQSAFADIYADTTYLGRRTIPCDMVYTEVSLRGEWLAVLCMDRETDAGMKLRLFRVKG